MMGYYSYVPRLPLSDYINSIWIWEDYLPQHPKERILPGGIMELIINLKDEPILTYYPDENFRLNRYCGLLVAGARSEYFITDTSQPSSVMGVWFKAGAAMCFFNVAGQELHNRHVPLELLWKPHEANVLYQRLMAAANRQQRFQIMEETLLERLLKSRQQHEAVRFALSQLNEVPQPIARLVEQIGLSSPRFIQVFRENVGLSPKVYARVLRFQSAIQRIAVSPKLSWTELALSSGYYDQSHFINEFQSFAGISPSEYLPENAEHPSNLGVYT